MGFSLPLCSTYPQTHCLNQNQNRRKSLTSLEFGVLLQSSIDARSLQQGKRLHLQILKAGLEGNRDLLPKLIKLFSVCGRIDYARKVFDHIARRKSDTFTWTAMISGYIKNGAPSEALVLFYEMLQIGLEPDAYTFSALLKASVELGLPQLAIQLHSLALKCDCNLNLSPANSLVCAYGSFGLVYRAREVFERMPLRDVVSWSSMIQACSSIGNYAESMGLCSRMQLEDNIKPNELTIVSLLPACGFFSSLRKAQAIHGFIVRNGYDSNLIVGSSIVNAYSRCGDPKSAFTIFKSLERRNVIVWTSMIEGFSMNGRFSSALDLFEKMQEQGIKPSHITLVVILSACSHGGLIDQGLKIFETMEGNFDIKPRAEHFACVVDMLGRRGRLDDAQGFIRRLSIRPTESMLGSLLGACQVHRNVELGEQVAYKLFKLEPNNAANYVGLSNIYASLGRWDDVERVRESMVSKGLSKDPGFSWIELKDKVHVFGAHDTSHSESEAIYRVLKELGELIVKAGYVPSTKYVLLNVEEEEDKKALLCSHSERLAIAFGLLKALPTVPIRVTKNLRVCGDCHDAIKLISKVTTREFIIRDTNRFHHFFEGSCSCGDYW